MTTDRLSPLDATFLHVEDAASHMHVACALVFDGDPPAYDDLLEHIAARLHLVPRYRQRLATVPFQQGRPKWVDDERFDLRYHVRATALPSPGGEYELQVLCGRIFSQQLRRDRPLWEMYLVEGLEGGRFAMLSKTHHALVDGISGLDILSVLFTPDEEGWGKGAAWALRRHMLRRGEDVTGLELKAFVPVSVRREEQRGGGTLGNQVAGMIAPLPVGCAEPRQCLAEISDALRGLKESGQAVGAQALTELT